VVAPRIVDEVLKVREGGGEELVFVRAEPIIFRYIGEGRGSVVFVQEIYLRVFREQLGIRLRKLVERFHRAGQVIDLIFKIVITRPLGGIRIIQLLRGGGGAR